MLEAGKESHINKISDLRSLLKKVNLEGEKRVNFIKNKNVSLFIQKFVSDQTLLIECP